MFYRIIEFIVESIYWLLLFLSPFLLFGIIAIYRYATSDPGAGFEYWILVPGAVAGIVLAEWVRRTYGCSDFFGALIGGAGNLQKKEKK